MAGTTVSFASIVKHFESLPDPRHARNRRHLLADIIVISVCGVIVGCEGPTTIVRWAKAKQDWLEQLLTLPNGIPSRDCVRRVLSALKPEAFQQCFQHWIAECLPGNTDGSHRTIAIDGKTMRRSHDRSGGLGPLHLVSAWASEQGIALGQIATEEKSNEITVIPELLDQIDVQGAVVTIDAIGWSPQGRSPAATQSGRAESGSAAVPTPASRGRNVVCGIWHDNCSDRNSASQQLSNWQPWVPAPRSCRRFGIREEAG